MLISGKGVQYIFMILPKIDCGHVTDGRLSLAFANYS